MELPCASCWHSDYAHHREMQSGEGPCDDCDCSEYRPPVWSDEVDA